MSIAYRISHGMIVDVVTIKSNSSKKILLFADWLFTTTTFIQWDILWTMNMSLKGPNPMLTEGYFLKILSTEQILSA